MALVIIMILFFSIWPSFINNTMVKDYGYGIINFFMLYIIAAYVRIYKDDFRISNWLLLPYFIINVLLGIYGIKHGIVYSYNFIVVLLSSIFVFLFFKKLKIKKPTIISTISSCSLAVLLIHGHNSTIHWMYQTLFNTKAYWSNNYMVFHMLISCLIIFVVCVIVELFRKVLFKYTIDKLINKIKLLNKTYDFK